MDKTRMELHIKLCKRNLNNNRVKCCVFCPFEEEIVGEYPDLSEKFVQKRDMLTQKKAGFEV